MKQTTAVFAALTAALYLTGAIGMGCGGRFAPAGSGGTGGSGGSGGTSGSAGSDGSGGSMGGSGGSGGSTSGSGGSAGDTGGSGGSAGDTGGSGGSAGDTGGSGGSAGDTGGSGGSTGGSAGSGGTDVPGTIRCGTSICAAISTPIGVLQPCCPMDTPNACGAVSPIGGCFTTTPGMADSRCPTVVVMSFPLNGCCRPNGMCGVNLQPISLGCNDPVLVGGAPASPCRGGSARVPAHAGAIATGSEPAP